MCKEAWCKLLFYFKKYLKKYRLCFKCDYMLWYFMLCYVMLWRFKCLIIYKPTTESKYLHSYILFCWLTSEVSSNNCRSLCHAHTKFSLISTNTVLIHPCAATVWLIDIFLFKRGRVIGRSDGLFDTWETTTTCSCWW